MTAPNVVSDVAWHLGADQAERRMLRGNSQKRYHVDMYRALPPNDVIVERLGDLQ